MRILNLFLVLLLVLPISLAAETLTESKIMASPPYQQNTGINQYYTVDFDGEGDAAVAAKIEIINYEKEPLTEIQIEIPGVNIRMVNLVQEYFLYTEECSQYQKYCDYLGCIDKCASYYQRQIWPPAYESINYDVTKLSNSVLYKIKFPHPINTSETSSLILYYKTDAYTEKSLGVFDFNFETAKIDYDTNNVNIGVSVEQGLHLKGTNEQVNYRPQFDVAAESFASGKVGAMADVSGLIGQGSYYKSATSLDPLESFSLTGSYATSWLNLYRFNICIGLLILAGIGLGAWIVLKKLKIFQEKNAKKCVFTGTISSLALIILWILTSLFLNIINQSGYYGTNQIVMLMVLLLVGIISLFIMFGPIVYFGLKYGVKEAAYVTVSFLVSLVVFGVIATIILILINPGYNGPIYRAAMETLKAV